ncbi:hypothetical protein ILUMI_13065 [Ignelater luminosus]|uniref:Uncharacterized protein n=1 Tax=Ignelater luminosus TaxID=2038154 RepID=A0A8K0CT34_IGNLU|nr:hypothetical protein ILUMI_13065 [Ignelater luminosus]
MKFDGPTNSADQPIQNPQPSTSSSSNNIDEIIKQVIAQNINYEEVSGEDEINQETNTNFTWMQVSEIHSKDFSFTENNSGIRPQIYNDYQKSPELKLSRKRIHDVIIRFNKRLSYKRQMVAAQKKCLLDKELEKKVVGAYKVNPSVSLQGMTFKTVKVPNRDAIQNQTAKTRATKLYDEFLTNFDRCVMMNNETCVYADCIQFPGQNFYVAKHRGGLGKKYRVKAVAKFPKKFLVWQALCSCGKRSKIFVTQGTINQEMKLANELVMGAVMVNAYWLLHQHVTNEKITVPQSVTFLGLAQTETLTTPNESNNGLEPKLSKQEHGKSCNLCYKRIPKFLVEILPKTGR